MTMTRPAQFDRLAPARYCLNTCYCRTCPHHAPLRPLTTTDHPDTATTKQHAASWHTREEPTWLDDRN